MNCAACSARVEKAVSKVKGVTSCSVSLLTNSMGVEGTAESSAVIEAVKAAGYGASLKNAKEENKEAETGGYTDTTVKKTSDRIGRIFDRAHVFFHGTYDVGLAAACVVYG